MKVCPLMSPVLLLCWQKHRQADVGHLAALHRKIYRTLHLVSCSQNQLGPVSAMECYLALWRMFHEWLYLCYDCSIIQLQGASVSSADMVMLLYWEIDGLLIKFYSLCLSGCVCAPLTGNLTQWKTGRGQKVSGTYSYRMKEKPCVSLLVTDRRVGSFFVIFQLAQVSASLGCSWISEEHGCAFTCLWISWIWMRWSLIRWNVLWSLVSWSGFYNDPMKNAD